MMDLRKDALAIFEAGLAAVEPAQAVRKFLVLQGDRLHLAGKTYDLSGYKNIFVVGAGKATAAMAQAVEDLLSHRISAGFINVKHGHSRPLKIISIQEAGHPVPDNSGLQGSKNILDLLERAGEKDLVTCLISGGGSALLPFPVPGLTLEDIQRTTQLLLAVGANIDEINTIRKHVSQVKGGRLAKRAFPAALIALILSDVIGDRLESIASGPTSPDPTTFLDCLNILKKYALLDRMPSAVLGYIEKGVEGQHEETVKPGDPVFFHVQNVIIGSNRQAVLAAKKKAAQLGYNSLVLSSVIEGETRDVAGVHASIAREIAQTENPVNKPACLISGGETTVTLRGQGLGGRNQEFVLAAALAIAGMDNVVVLSCGTDGTDGPTDAAGALADGQTVQRAEKLGLDASRFLFQNDSYHFFQAVDDLVFTGPTLTNVMDLRVILVK